MFAALLLATAIAACDDEKEAEPITVNEREAPEESEPESEGEFQMGDEVEGDPAAAPQPGPDAAPRARARAPKPGTDPAPGRSPNVKSPAGDAPKRVAVASNFLKVEQMLDRQDVREAVSYSGLLEAGDFAGQTPSKTYNATRLASEGGFGIALQVWKPGSAAAATRQFDKLYSQSLGGERTQDAGDASFRTEHDKLRSMVYLDKRRSAVAWLTCESDVCSFEELADLALRVQKRL